MFFNCCTPATGEQEESIQEAHLDEYVGLHLAAPTLMQSRPAMRKDDIIKFHDPKNRPGGAKPESSLTALLKLADLGEAGAAPAVDQEASVVVSSRSLAESARQAGPGAEAKVQAALAQVMMPLQASPPQQPASGQGDGEEPQAPTETDRKSTDVAELKDFSPPSSPTSDDGGSTPLAPRVGDASPDDQEDRFVQIDTQEAKEHHTREEEMQPHEYAQQQEAAMRLWKEAKEERQAMERARQFLNDHGHRHVKAKSSQRTLSKTYPLHAAVCQGDTEMVRLLLKLGADVSQRNHWHQTPLEYALKRNERSGNLGPMIHLLRAAEAKPESSR